MQRRRITSVTSWTLTASTKRKLPKLLALCACISLLCPAAAAQSATATDLATLLAAYRAALSPTGVPEPDRWESIGTLSGVQLRGRFHAWHQRDRDRFDRSLGVRNDRFLQLGERRFEQNAGGEVIELKGLLRRRGVTQDFIASTDLFARPQYSSLHGETVLDDGRAVFRIDVSPPGGDVETIYLDAHTHLLDRLEYLDGDGLFTIDYSDYRPLHGYFVAFKTVQSDGDHPFDITQYTTKIIAGRAIPESIFAPLVPTKLIADRPVTVPLIEERGALYTEVVIHGQTLRFLLDSGAQGLVLDSHVAGRLGLVPEGSFEVRGASRIGGIGIARLDQIHIGAAILPVGIASILDLAGATAGHFAIDGILGYSLFGAAMVQIDPAKKTMTLAAPGSFTPAGAKLDIDVDRELPETAATVNGVEGRFLLDTGNGNELLLFRDFLEAHKGLLGTSFRPASSSYGVGGATRATEGHVDLLEIGPYRLFHRSTSLILSTQGAFADRFDAGNIGLGILQNFVITFDAYNRTMYLAAGANFDDGRDRPTQTRQ